MYNFSVQSFQLMNFSPPKPARMLASNSPQSSSPYTAGYISWQVV